MIERIGKAMTFGGSGTAVGCGAVSAVQSGSAHGQVIQQAIDVATPVTQLSTSDIGVYVGIAFGAAGLLIQGYSVLARRLDDRAKRREERELHKLSSRRELLQIAKLERAIRETD